MDIPQGMTAESIRIATLDNGQLGILSELILYAGHQPKLRYRAAVIQLNQRCNHKHRWHCNKRQKNNNTCSDATQSNKQLYLNYIGVEKTRLLAHEYIYWINMNAEIEEMVKNTPPTLISKQYDQKIR